MAMFIKRIRMILKYFKKKKKKVTGREERNGRERRKEGRKTVSILNLIPSFKNSSGETVIECSENTNEHKCFWK